MQEFAIAIGAKRTSKVWKTEQWSLETFIERLRDPKVTNETMAEYAAMNKDEKDSRKDVGGYVAGALKDKNRGAGHVQWRSMITLDLDNVDVNEEKALSAVAERCPYFYILHPTHSHRPEVPRLRLIVPLETNVSEEQYEPIARRIAADINISWFDPTTFQASRLMFWPSIPRDLDYAAAFVEHEGPLCAGADVLARYTDWRNIGEWPGTSHEEDQVQHRAKTQQDPREKQGPVGAFCRAYSIQEVIAAYLPDVYVPTDKENRYTYAAGSTVGGLVLYDDIFAYDNHATSPASGILCNAFDLVRVHRFAAEDVDSRATIPTNLPSYKKMLELMEGDQRVQSQRAADLRERQAAAETEFDYEDIAEEGKDWREGIKFDKNDCVAPTIRNVKYVLLNDPNFKGKLYADIFSTRDIVVGELPWNPDPASRDWSDADTEQLRLYLEEKCDGLTKKDIIESGLVNAFQANRKHPIREYLEGLPEWDGTKRVADLLIDYLGAEPSEYTRTVTKTHLVAAIARVMTPGVKYDTMIVLSGKQGIGKSTLIRLLCGNQWFNDSLREFNGDKAFERIQGSWMIEIAELTAYLKSESSEFKAFVSKTNDIYRPAYGHRLIYPPRQCIFWGTTNDTQFLRDITGERRIWPIDVGLVPTVKDVFSDLPEERDQIWAEALAAYHDNWPLFLSREMEEIADDMRSVFMEEDDRKDSIEAFLEKDITDNWQDLDLMERRDYLDGTKVSNAGKPVKRQKVTAFEIWVECFNKNVNEPFPKYENTYITNLMNGLPGWKTVRESIRLDNVVYGGKQKRLFFMRK